ncbi:Aldose sugar dehydrogenase YliI [Anaerolineae bacterium]|nr:Aldose sugar dehydrogenase YliI [Anaerolineae bacterium]
MKTLKIYFWMSLLLLTACATPAPTPTVPPTSQPTDRPTNQPATQTPNRPTTQQSNNPTTSPSNNQTPSIEIFAKGLDTPWGIDFASDGRAFFTERLGVIRVMQNGKLQTEPWIKMDSNEVGEGGLLGLALDPQFAQNHFVYVAYTYRAQNGRLQNRLVRLRDDNGKGVLDKTLLDGAEGNSNHDGGRVKFGPDGEVYWTVGDSQNTALAQDVKSLNGKILRLNSDGTIPADNPFPNSPVYSYGHRNPQGLAWQPGTKRLYATEHGPSGVNPNCCRDEVNLIEPGKNYGWSLITGDQTREGMLAPVLHSGNTTTWAPSGATFATRGPWAGSLLFGGLRGQALYRVMLDKNDPRKVANFEKMFEGEYGRLRDVVEGPDGALYVLTSNRDGRGSPTSDDDRILRITWR